MRLIFYSPHPCGQSQQPDPGTGLTLPAQYTEDQFFEAGRFLAKIKHGMQWAIGDWFNAIPWSDKEAACKKAGLNYKTTRNYGWVAGQYPMSLRNDRLSFDHHRMVAIDALAEDQRTSLLRRAEWGEPDPKEEGKRKPWTAARLAQERDTLLGREKIPLPDFDAKVDQAVMTECRPVDKKPGRR